MYYMLRMFVTGLISYAHVRSNGLPFSHRAFVAQMVEQWSSNPKVVGSSPT